MLTNWMLSYDLIWNNTAMHSCLIICSDLYPGLQRSSALQANETYRGDPSAANALCQGKKKKAILEHKGAEEKYPNLCLLTNKLASKIINPTFAYNGGMHGWPIIFLLEVWFRRLPPPPPCAGGGSVETTGRPIDRASTLLPSLSASYF